jgi:adenylate cyclase class 2
MYEVEVKVRAAHDAVEVALADAGAAEREVVEQADTYYDAPHRAFAETDEALRVRRETRDGETAARITYKGPKVDAASKTRREVETGVESGDDAAAIFDALGFEPAATVRKHRRHFELDGYTVTLDRVEGLGEFVEVEMDVELDGSEAKTESEEAVEAAREGAFDVLRRLDLDPDDGIRASYLELLLA